jgi:hypothetical protein
MRILNYEKGQSLFELVVAIAISALVVVAMVSLATNAIQNSNYSKNKALASTYTQQAMEWLRGQRDADIDAFLTHAETPTWCLADISTDLKAWSLNSACANDSLIAGTPFKRQVTFNISSQNGRDVVEADVLVTWADSQGTHEVRSVTNLVDLR